MPSVWPHLGRRPPPLFADEEYEVGSEEEKEHRAEEEQEAAEWEQDGLVPEERERRRGARWALQVEQGPAAAAAAPGALGPQGGTGQAAATGGQQQLPPAQPALQQPGMRPVIKRHRRTQAEMAVERGEAEGWAEGSGLRAVLGRMSPALACTASCIATKTHVRWHAAPVLNLRHAPCFLPCPLGLQSSGSWPSGSPALASTRWCPPAAGRCCRAQATSCACGGSTACRQGGSLCTLCVCVCVCVERGGGGTYKLQITPSSRAEQTGAPSPAAQRRHPLVAQVWMSWGRAAGPLCPFLPAAGLLHGAGDAARAGAFGAGRL